MHHPLVIGNLLHHSTMKKSLIILIVLAFQIQSFGQNSDGLKCCCPTNLEKKIIIKEKYKKDEFGGEYRNTLPCFPPVGTQNFPLGVTKILADIDSTCHMTNIRFLSKNVNEIARKEYVSELLKLSVDYYINDIKVEDCAKIVWNKDILIKITIE